MTKNDTVKVYIFRCGECDSVVVDEWRHGYLPLPKELYDRYTAAAKNLALILEEIKQHTKEQ
jgi:hypothetical protein